VSRRSSSAEASIGSFAATFNWPAYFYNVNLVSYFSAAHYIAVDAKALLLLARVDSALASSRLLLHLRQNKLTSLL